MPKKGNIGKCSAAPAGYRRQYHTIPHRKHRKGQYTCRKTCLACIGRVRKCKASERKEGQLGEEWSAKNVSDHGKKQY
jgi:hypothetical protein